MKNMKKKMNNFKLKKIGKLHNLADKLKKARLEKGLSLSDVQKKTNINIKYLDILERGEYEKLPGNIYVRSWLKIYGKLLGLPVLELLEDYKDQNFINKQLKKVIKNKKKSKLKNELLKPKIIKMFIIVLIIFILLGYLAWEIKKIISPPYIEIINPNNNYITGESTIVIYGKTIPEVELMINNESVLLNKNGNFEKEINLMIGLNNLEISAKKKYSKIKYTELSIFREK